MRALDPAFTAALGRKFIRPVVFVYLDWPGEAVRAHSWTGTFTWGGHDWRGVGEFGAIRPAAEGRASATKRLTVSLVGFPEKIAADGAHIRNRVGAVYWGLLDDDGALVSDPDLLLSGVMDSRRFTISSNGDGRVLHGLDIDIWSGASPRRPGASLHTHDDQLSEHSGDTAGRHLTGQPERVILWPE